MADKGKPALAILIAKAKAKKGPPAPGGASDADAGDDYGSDAKAASPELVDCMAKFDEALADHDHEGMAQAFQTAFMHADEAEDAEEGEGEE